MYQINDDIPLGCIYESEDSSTKYCPMCNHDDVPYCQWFEDEPEAAIGIDERPVYCPILPSAQPEPCEDAVSRQAEIKCCTFGRTSLGLIDELRRLPSVTAKAEQPEYIPDTKAIPSEKDCVDLSERVTATFYDDENEEWSQKTVTIRDVLDSVCDEYTVLPSAQPERTCLNCGRTANNGGWYADGRTRCPIEEHYALPKDGFCHLWEKRNVTDDDYPERREE